MKLWLDWAMAHEPLLKGLCGVRSHDATVSWGTGWGTQAAIRSGDSMTKLQFLSKLETLLEADLGSIREADPLSTFDRWDSLTMMGFIAMVDEELGVTVPATKLVAATSVNDLVSLVQDRLAG